MTASVAPAAAPAPAASGDAPLPESAVAARAEIAALRHDTKFTAALIDTTHADHRKTQERFSELHRVAYPELGQPAAEFTPTFQLDPAMSPEAARYELEQKRRDHAFTERLANNDRAANDELAQLTERAHGTPPTEAEVIDAWYPAAEKVTDYEFPSPVAQGETLTPELATADLLLREAMLYARVPADIGTALARTADNFAGQWAALDEQGRRERSDREFGRLEQLWGPEQTAAKVKLAGRLLKAVDKKFPGLSKALDSTGILNSAEVVAAIAMHAERIHARIQAEKW